MEETSPPDLILVVNDAPDQLALAAAVLRQAGYHVVEAADGREALQLARRMRPALIISDVVMPYGDGLELTRAVRADSELARTPILLLSAQRKDATAAIEGLAAGADDYLEAPYDPLRLVAQTARLLERTRTEAHYRAIIESAHDAIYTLDLAGRYTSINRAGELLTGYTREELRAMDWRAIVAPEHLALTEQMIARKLAGREEITFYEVEVMTKTGERVPVEVSSQLIREGERAVGVLGIARDITERRRAERERRAMAEQQAELEKMRSLGQLSAGVAHNFNNVLAAILGRTQLLLRATTDERQRRNLAVIETAALDAAEIVRRIQTFSRRAPAEKFQVVSLTQLLADAIQLTRTRWADEAHARGLSYDVRLDSDCAGHDRLAASPSELREVFVNLLLNSLEAMPTGGHIHCRVRCTDEQLTAEIEDTGPGIAPELIARIFEPFFTTKGAQGTGLGLAVSYGIVKRHGGEIEVNSTPGAGTTFTLRFHAHEEE